MFVLLEHKTTSGADAADVHWDLIVQVPGQALLPTWRLAENPLAAPTPITAERIADHRPAYLDYEGAVSGERGTVRRIERGAAEVLRYGEAVVRVRFDGEGLCGVYELRVGPDGGWTLRRGDPD